jgi:soluble lytic murein transglycosylase-like protein
MRKIAIIFLTLWSATPVSADVYKFVDGDGHTYYTDEPRSDLYKRIIKSVPHSDNDSNRSKSPVFIKTARSRLFKENKSRFEELISQTAARHQVDAKLLHAVIQTESAYNAGAISSAGAVGLMQLMPATARRFGVVDRNDPDQNVDGGTRYLRYLLDLFPNDLDLAVAAYNAGENAVIRYNNTIPPYPETQNYVRQVLALYKQ